MDHDHLYKGSTGDLSPAAGAQRGMWGPALQHAQKAHLSMGVVPASKPVEFEQSTRARQHRAPGLTLHFDLYSDSEKLARSQVCLIIVDHQIKRGHMLCHRQQWTDGAHSATAYR